MSLKFRIFRQLDPYIMQTVQHSEPIRCMIIDDEYHCLEVMQLLINRLPFPIEIVKMCLGANEGLRALKEYKIDLLFLDIKMPEMSGFELLENLDYWDFGLIFTTAHHDYAIQALRLSAIDYLMKPIQETELEASILAFIQKRHLINPYNHLLFREQISAIKRNDLHKIGLSTMDGITFFDMKAIVAAESDGNLSKLYLTGDQDVYINQSLKSIEEKLVPFGFLRVHKSFLINPERVKKYSRKDGGFIEMENQLQIYISRQKREMILSMLERIGGRLS
jgi:two-component system, LytTR family, response regulator